MFETLAKLLIPLVGGGKDTSHLLFIPTESEGSGIPAIALCRHLVTFLDERLKKWFGECQQKGLPLKGYLVWSQSEAGEFLYEVQCQVAKLI